MFDITIKTAQIKNNPRIRLEYSEENRDKLAHVKTDFWVPRMYSGVELPQGLTIPSRRPVQIPILRETKGGRHPCSVSLCTMLTFERTNQDTYQLQREALILGAYNIGLAFANQIAQATGGRIEDITGYNEELHKLKREKDIFNGEIKTRRALAS